MILVLGETYDALLGVNNLLTDPVASPSMANNMPAFEGEAFGERLIGITCGSTDYLSCLCATKAIELYHPDLVISMGESSALSPRLQPGDIVIGNRVFIHGVNFIEQGLPYGSIPGYPSHFYSDIEAARLAESVGTKIPTIRVLRGDVLSGEAKIVEQEQFASIMISRYASNGHLLCYDMTTGGIALACAEAKIPFLPLKAITYVPLEGQEGLMRERRISLTANEDVARLLFAFLKERKGGKA